MNKCLCCRKTTADGSYYHKSCLKKLFGSEKPPVIKFDTADLVSEISKNAGKMSISGVQIKASVILNKKSNIIEIVQSGGTHILKPEPFEYPELPQNENLFMNIAEVLGMEVPPHGLFDMPDKKKCYIIKRFDRSFAGEKTHVEDMAQLLEMPPDSKYESSIEKVGRMIRKVSKRPFLDLINFYERVVFCFLIGNGDMHLKNWSVILPEDGNIRLSPCYDLISSKLYLSHEDETALAINGKRNNLKISDFEELANFLEIDGKATLNSLNKLKSAKETIIRILDDELSPERIKKLKEIISDRYKRLSEA
ncbi:MAG: HipA domain-containing protein [Actinomycetota bacterium]|nr:HipA domain-containing protein [Actinomycetota bacterium]